jgi:hypothetical protein
MRPKCYVTEAQRKIVILLEDYMKLWLTERNRSKTLREEEKKETGNRKQGRTGYVQAVLSGQR